MRSWFLLAALSTLAACSGGSGDTDETDTEAEDPGYPSSFTSGKFRMTSFVIRPLDDGDDLDADGTGDNNLPKVLDLAAIVLPDQPLSTEEINATIATNIEEDVLITLMDASYVELDLSIAVLSGVADETGALSVDPLSMDGDTPRSVMSGEFTNETAFFVEADAIEIPATFVPGEPPLLVPIKMARLAGEMDADGATGTLVGVLPVDALRDQVVEPLIPDEGVDRDGDGDIDMTEEEVLEIVTEFANDEDLSDWPFEDGTRGVTAAFSWEAAPATWTE